MSGSLSKITLMPISLHFLQLSKSWLAVYNASVVMETSCPSLSLTKCVFLHEWLEYIVAPLSAISIMTLFSMMSVEFGRDPVIVMDAQQSAHKYPLSSSIGIGLPDGLAISTFPDGLSSTLCMPRDRCTTSISTIVSPSKVVCRLIELLAPGAQTVPRLITCSNPTLYRCGLCSSTHCSDVLLDSADPDTASSMHAKMEWRWKMSYSLHGPVVYSLAKFAAWPFGPLGFPQHIRVT